MERDIDIYMICPVRKATEEQKKILVDYKNQQEAKGLKVHYPANDTNQEDETGGYRICMDHVGEIQRSKTVHTFWVASTGSYVDLGTALNEHKARGLDMLLINREDVEKIVLEQKLQGINKSYEIVLLKLDDIADNSTRLK